MQVLEEFSLAGKVTVVMGGSGVLGGAIAEGFGAAGAQIVVTGRAKDRLDACVKRIEKAGGSARSYTVDVFDRDSIVACCDQIYADCDRVDVLLNAVGGNMPGATTSKEQSFFDLPADAMQKVMDLNLLAGTIAPCQVFGARMKDNPDGGSIINISSMNAVRPLTRIPAYSAAKAAVSNFTQWLAVHLAQEYSPKLRVNAISPGFFLTAQNRFLLMDEKTGRSTARGKTIIDHTPMGRYGSPEDLIGVAVWLASDASRFVTGTVVSVDGGFSAFSGV
jgi:NAD(P)-dependent dehydrogenase (short-subunit alcohol dehydrogenase family)